MNDDGELILSVAHGDAWAVDECGGDDDCVVLKRWINRSTLATPGVPSIAEHDPDDETHVPLDVAHEIATAMLVYVMKRREQINRERHEREQHGGGGSID